MTVESKSPVTRRAITRGIAWSVPAIAIAAAAPAMAQSPVVSFEPVGTVCKYSGGSVDGVKHAYLFPVRVRNLAHESVTITAVSASVVLDSGEVGGTPEFWSGLPHDGGTAHPDGKITLEESGSATFSFVADETGNSANTGGGVITMVVKVTVDGTDISYTEPVTLRFESSPPCEEKKTP